MSKELFCRELNKHFSSRDKLFKALIESKKTIMAIKKSSVKHADGFSCVLNDGKTVKNNIVKAQAGQAADPTQLPVKVVINTTNLFDSHGDVHIDGLWKRSLKANNKKLHLQEHKQSFDKVISDDAEATVEDMDFKDLTDGQLEGPTQALVFYSVVKQDRNPEMFKQYANGWVKNHSVGMQYVDYVLCINSEEKYLTEEKENWDKYYPAIVNKDDVDQVGYFWAVLEAKVLEGSAVLIGSNFATPTLQNKETATALPDQIENEPPVGTHKSNKLFNPNYI